MMGLLDIPIPAQMFVRDAGGGKAMVLCVVPTQRIPDNIRHGAFLNGHILIMDDTAYYQRHIEGWLAEDILTREWDVRKMKPFKIGNTYSAPAEAGKEDEL